MLKQLTYLGGYLKGHVQGKKKEYRINLGVIAIIALLVYCAVYQKGLFVIMIFEVLDFMKNTIKFKFNYIPIDLSFIFGIAAAYYVSPWVAVFILFLASLNRFTFGFFKVSYLYEGFVNLVIFFLMPLLKGLPFLAACYLALPLKYLVVFSFNYFVDPEDFEGSLYHVLKALVSLGIIYFLAKGTNLIF